MPSTPEESQEQVKPQAQDLITELYKEVLLLGIMVVTVTCMVGLDPPGGLWQKSKDGHRTGDPIMHDTRPVQYMVFYIFNSAAFAVSLVLVVYVLLLSARKNLPHLRLSALKVVVVVDLILLVVAFIAGSCRGLRITIYASVHCGAIVIIVAILVYFSNKLTKNHKEVLCKESRKVLMLLAIFATTVTYTASLTPPGGFWEHAPAGEASHRAGDPILLERDLGRMVVFFAGNSTAFVMSVFIMMLLLFVKLTKDIFRLCCICIMLVMVGLVAAYIAGVSRHPKMDSFIIIAFLIGCIILYYLFHKVFPPKKKGHASSSSSSGGEASGALPQEQSSAADRSPSGSEAAGGASSPVGSSAADRRPSGGEAAGGALQPEQSSGPSGGEAAGGASSSPVGSSAAADRRPNGGEAAGGALPPGGEATGGASSSRLEGIARDLILLLAIMVATVTYQAGLQPPGGVWRGTSEGHSGGGLILLVTHAAQYKVFFFFNTAAFLTSIVVVIMVQASLVNQHALEAAVILDLLGLMGAYAAGTIRGHQIWSSVGLFTLVAAVFIFLCLVASLVLPPLSSKSCIPLPPRQNISKESLRRREVLMLLAIMAITMTYPVGLTPPGKFWLELGDGEHHAGDPVLVDTYPQLYKLFLTSNTATFMISVAVILFLVSRELNSVGERCWRILSFCMSLLVLVLLMTTMFVAGANRRRPWETCAVILAWQAGTSLLIFLMDRDIFDTSKWRFEDCPDHGGYHEYLMGVSILAASVAYQAGLSPPGGIWLDDGHGHAAGNPVLYDTDRLRYLAFYYCNTVSYAASIAVNVLLLLDVLGPKRFELSERAAYMVLVPDVLSLLMAYAIGSSRDKGTWMYVLATTTAILAYFAIFKMVNRQSKKNKMVNKIVNPRRCGNQSATHSEHQM